MMEPAGKRTKDGVEYHREKGRREEGVACAELVRGAGCLCFHIWMGGRGPGHQGPKYSAQSYPQNWGSAPHDPRCPEALAAAIEGRGHA